jgi:hypothetical protein
VLDIIYGLTLLLLLLAINKASIEIGGSNVEDAYRTQIVLMNPRSYINDSSPSLLQCRPTGSRLIHYNQHLGNHTRYIKNFIYYAATYSYKSRYLNATCPMEPNGIAAHCDWALMVPCLFGLIESPPRIVYAQIDMLPHFVENLLPILSARSWKFILVTSGSDGTTPNNLLDERYKYPLRGFGVNGSYFDRLVNDTSVVHWFAENRDQLHPKLSSLPTGVLSHSTLYDHISHSALPLRSRGLKVMSADRIRAGPQWSERMHVRELCHNASFCSHPRHTKGKLVVLSHYDYLKHASSVPFVLCPHGGGIDPSPKAFEAILVGTIPIIRYTPFIFDSYSLLPVVFVRDWSDIFGQNDDQVQSLLATWIDRLSPYFEVKSTKRSKVLHVSRNLSFDEYYPE